MIDPQAQDPGLAGLTQGLPWLMCVRFGLEAL